MGGIVGESERGAEQTDLSKTVNAHDAHNESDATSKFASVPRAILYYDSCVPRKRCARVHPALLVLRAFTTEPFRCHLR